MQVKTNKVVPINFCPLLSDFSIPLTSQWFKSDKNVCGPISLLLCVISQRLSRLRRERSTNFAHQLGRHCIHTHLGTLSVVRFFIDV